MFNKIVRYYAKKWLNEAYRVSKKTRNVKIKTWNNSKSVGLLWNPQDEGSIETYEQMRRILQSKGLKVTGCGYIHTNRERETLHTFSHSGFWSKREVNWFGKPKTQEMESFINEEFDLLIDLSISKTLPSHYLLVHSKAIFKVGFQGTEENYYDFHVDVSGNPKSNFLMEQIIFYLDTINNKG